MKTKSTRTTRSKPTPVTGEIRAAQVYTRREAMSLLRLSNDSFGELIRGGAIVPRVVGRRQLFLGETLLAFVRPK